MFQSVVQCSFNKKKTRENMFQKRTTCALVSVYGMYVCVCMWVRNWGRGRVTSSFKIEIDN